MRLRVLDTGEAPARWNVAASAALLESVDAGAPATLRFHRYPPSCIVGRFQDVATELDLPACRAAGVALARRVTGGGAVVMGPGILAFDLVVPGSGPATHGFADRAGDALVAALSELGLAADRPTRGSVAIGGLKVSGSAGRLAKRAMLQQATLILDLSTAPPLSLLRRRTEGGRPSADPRHCVTDLRTARGERDPSPQGEAKASDVAALITRHLADAFGFRPETDRLSDAEHERAAAILAGSVGRDEFVFSGEADGRLAA